MAEKSYNKITDFSSERDPSNGLPWSGKSVREFINESASIAKQNRSSKIGAEYWIPGSFRKLNFASEEDLQTWLDTGDESLILSQTEPTPVGTVYQVKVNNKMGSDILYYTTQAEKAEITVSFESQQKGVTDTVWDEFIEDYYVSVLVDKGGLGKFVPIITDQLVTSGSDFTFDIRNSLGTGNNRVRIVAVGTESETKGSKLLTLNLTSMYLAPSNFTWYKPFIQGETYALGGMNIGGNIQKVLKIKVSKEGYEKLYEVNIGGDIYTTTAYVFNGMEFPEAGTGVYNVDMWLDANGLTSDHLVYNIICVSQEDKFTAQLVAIGDPAKVVYNFTDNVLFKYSVYNGGTASGTPHIRISSIVNTNPTILINEDLVNVATASPLTYTASLEIEMEDESAALQLEAILTYANKQEYIFPVDNSKSYPATTGAVFYMNPSARNNAQDNRGKIINAVNSSQIDATFTRMSWAEGTDGWTTDDEGRRCLRLPAMSTVDIAYQPLAKVSQKTIEFVYKVKNAADYDEPIITICSDVNDPRFRGIKITPKNILVHSRDLNVEDSLQDYNTTDEETLHVLITIIPNYKTNYGNLAQIYCNGTKVRSFSFETADRWDVASNVVMGSQTADLFVYKMRVYDRGFESYDALKNYVNSLPSASAKENAMLNIEAPLDDSYKLSYDECVRNGLNTMVVEILDQDQTIPSIVNPSSKQCNLWIDIKNPIEGELDEDFSYLFGGNDILNQTIEGQGTTAMTYARWNFRWKLDSTYNKRRITAKKNFASSMHSHKMGATRLFNDLNEKIVGANDANARTAVFQYPVYGFQKILIEGTVGQYRYEPIGLYTIGPDKGDKPTFGFDNKAFKNTLIHMEGTDHTPKGVGMDYPWNKLVYSGGGEGFGSVLQTGDVEVAWEVGAAGDYDPKDDPTEVKALLDVEFQPAYNVAYNNSPYIHGVTETLAQINADVNAWQAKKTEDGAEYSGLEFFTDGVYDLYFFNAQTQKYEANGINLLTDLGLSSSSVSGKTLAQKTELFKEKRRQRFANNWGQYWDTRDAVFTYTAIMVTGATDNFKKNSYPYKFKALADGGKWRWRHDDLDTIFDINNQGLAAKIYSILVGDKTETGSVYRGDNSVFWTLVKETQQEAIKSMVHSIYNAMVELSPYGSNTLDKVYGCYRRYFWDMAQDYFPSSAYNKDAEWTYEDTWAAGQFSSDGINPLTQALGGHYEAERDWVKLRIIFTAAYYNYGPFNPNGYQDISAGQLGYGGANTHTFMFVPAIDFNPTVLRGQSGYFSVGDRVKAGETASLTIPNISGADTRIYVQGVDWMEDVGDLSTLQVSADYTTLSVGSKRLKRFKIGDVNASKVKTNVKNIDFKECPSMMVVDARNVSSLGGNIDLTKMPRLMEAYFGGTGVKSVNLANGSKITKLQIGDEVTQLSLMNLMFLDRDGFDYTSLPKLEFLRIENCPALNPYQMLKELYNLDNSALRDIRVIGFDEQATSEDFDMFANLANDVDKDGNPHIYNGIDSEGSPVDDSKPIIEGTLTIAGNIYDDTYESIKGAFPNLNMNYHDIYVRFKDPEVLRVLMAESGKGDGVGITVDEAKSIADIYFWFKGNTTLTSFNELSKLPVTLLRGYAFQDCISLKTIDISNIVKMEIGVFLNCISLVGDYYLPKLVHCNHSVFNNTSIHSFDAPNLIETPEAAVFGKCKSLVSVNIPKAEQVGNGFFGECSSLESVDISSATLIGKYCFQNCSKINIINAPQVTKVDNNAFMGCGQLTSVNMPKLKSLGGWSFENCKSLKSVDFPKVTEIVGDDFRGIFYGCSGLETVNLPNLNNWSMPSHVFSGCANLTSVIIGSVKSAADDTFYSCQKLTYIAGIEAVESIGSRCFYNCSSLEKIEFNNITSIGTYALSACDALTTVILRVSEPPVMSGTAISDNAGLAIYVPLASVAEYKSATNWSAYESKIYPLTVYDKGGVEKIIRFADAEVERIVKTDGWDADGDGYIMEVEAESITGIGTIFKGNTTIKSFNELSKSGVRILGYNAFENCTNLQTIDISKIETMYSSVFENCTNLVMNINAPNLTYMENSAFRNTGILSFTAPLIEKIWQTAFSGSASLMSVDAKSVLEVEYGAFYLCPSLETVNLESATRIHGYAFNGCSSLPNINIPEVTLIGYNAFQDCSSLEQINIPKVTEIESTAFTNCTALTKVTANSLTTIRENAFQGCSSLETIIMPMVSDIKIGAFNNCTELTSVVLDNVLNIETNAFYNTPKLVCDINLKSFEGDLPAQVFMFSGITSFKGEGVVNVGYGAFYGCTNLRTAEFGNIESLSEVVFNGCSSLQSVVIKSTTPPTLGSGAISLTDMLQIFVPDASVDAYKSATNWSYLASRIRPLSEYVEPSNEE